MEVIAEDFRDAEVNKFFKSCVLERLGAKNELVEIKK